MANIETLKKTASQVRRDIIRMVGAAKSGHPGGSLGITDVMTALYFSEMHHDPKTWTREGKGQDMFVISAGHLAPVYYSVLARSGYFPVSELGTLRKFGTRLQGHPCVTDHLPGVFAPSGSLGQGLSAAAGMALGKKIDGDPGRVYVLLGDGESEEGQIWEAAMWAPHHKVDNLSDKWAAFGWDVIVADGHDFDSILQAFELAHAQNGKPKMILFKTEMGHGVDFMAGTHKWHGKAPSAEEVEKALAQLEETLGDY